MSPHTLLTLSEGKHSLEEFMNKMAPKGTQKERKKEVVDKHLMACLSKRHCGVGTTY